MGSSHSIIKKCLVDVEGYREKRKNQRKIAKITNDVLRNIKKEVFRTGG